MLIHIHQQPSGLSDGQSRDHAIDVDPNIDIAALKDIIADKCGVPRVLQRLYMGPTAQSAAVPLDDKERLFVRSNERTLPEGHHRLILNVVEDSLDAPEDAWRDSGKGINR
jgi:hypothetical protein